MRRYGRWAGDPAGTRENIIRCVVQVSNGRYFCQCLRKRGYGKDGLFCKQHSKMNNILIPKDE